MQPSAGLEPATFALQVRCSTTKLTGLLEMAGFDPATSRMQSERSTN